MFRIETDFLPDPDELRARRIQALHNLLELAASRSRRFRLRQERPSKREPAAVKNVSQSQQLQHEAKSLSDLFEMQLHHPINVQTKTFGFQKRRRKPAALLNHDVTLPTNLEDNDTFYGPRGEWCEVQGAEEEMQADAGFYDSLMDVGQGGFTAALTDD